MQLLRSPLLESLKANIGSYAVDVSTRILVDVLNWATALLELLIRALLVELNWAGSINSTTCSNRMDSRTQ
jgi:hypothetical protein